MKYSHKYSNIFLVTFLIFITELQASYKTAGKERDNLETQVKAAYIINFTRFVYWGSNVSDEPNKSVKVFVLGNDTITKILTGYSRRDFNNPNISVKQLRNLDDVSECNLLYISRNEKDRMQSILDHLEGSEILTVSDIPGFAQHGGMVGFFIKDRKVKIELNLARIRKAGLNISAKLIEVSKIVSDED